MPDIPETLKRAAERVANTIAAGEYARLVDSGEAGRLKAGDIERTIREYGRTLLPLPTAAWDYAFYVPSEVSNGAILEVPFFTAEEGRSDLELKLSFMDRATGAGLEIVNIRVP